MNYIFVNEELFPAETAVIPVSDRGYRYGEGIFETIRVRENRIPLLGLHWERLEAGLQVLKWEKPAGFTREKMEQQIHLLCRKNDCASLARVRVTVSARNKEPFGSPRTFRYVIEARPLDEAYIRINETGLHIGIFPLARKSCDLFSNLKSAQYLPYAMASLYASENNLDDCLVLNSKERIADSTIANIFWIKDDIIRTPPLSEGCVGGVMRRWLLENLPACGFKVEEEPVNPSGLETATEIFLSNALRGIRWVSRFGEKRYGHELISAINDRLTRTIQD